MNTPRTQDWGRAGLWLPMALLLGLGLVMVYSSSGIHAAKTYGSSTHFLWRQCFYALLGLGACFAVAQLPTEWVKRWAMPAFGISVLLCIMVLIPGVGVVRGGARRWFSLAGLSFQPSEFAKLAVVVATAWVLARRENRPAASRPSLLVPVVLAQIPVALILREPDLGTALVIELVVVTMVFVAGVRMRTMLILFLSALPVFYSLVMDEEWRIRRVLAYLDPWAYRQTVGYQVTEALISIGSGGMTGVGLGEGKHGLFFLPEAHTDFIFAIIGQELGLLGVCALLLAFSVLLWSASGVALEAGNRFDRYLALGLSALIGVPAVFNMCVVTGLLPTKGLPLPFVSAGGTNLVMTLLAMGLLLRIAKQNRMAHGEEEA